MRLKPIQVVRIIALGLMLCGLALSVRGRLAEFNSFNLSSNAFGQDDSLELRERQLAFNLKYSGVVLVFAGPAIWLVGNLLVRRRQRTSSSAA